jgi:hypothetical protein
VALFNGKSNDRDLITSAPIGSDPSDSEPEDVSTLAQETRPSDKSDIGNAQGTTANPPRSPSHPSRKRAAETSPIPARHPQPKPKKSRRAKVDIPAPIDKKGKGKEKAKLHEEPLTRLKNAPSSTPSTLPTTLPCSSMIATTSHHLSSTPASLPAPPSLPAAPASQNSTPASSTPPIPTPSSAPTLCSSSPCSTSSLFDDPEPNWNTDNDPLLAVMGSDPSWQMDPDQLDQLAELELREGGPLSSMSSPPPSSLPQTFSPVTLPSPLSLSPPLQQDGMAMMTPGVRPRQSKQDDARKPSMQSSSNSHLPPLEEIGGAPLIPGRMGRFRGISRNHGRGKIAPGRKIK